MPIAVISKHRATPEQREAAIYIGRGSVLGNPFKVRPHGPHERDESIRLYREWLEARLAEGDETIARALNAIWRRAHDDEDVLLMCFCAPRACHGDVIKALVESKL